MGGDRKCYLTTKKKGNKAELRGSATSKYAKALILSIDKILLIPYPFSQL
jgi:hypothetical protein